MIKWTQNPSYKRIGLALCASIALHGMLFGGFNFALPSALKKEAHVIEARLAPKPEVKKLETIPLKEEAATKAEPPVKKPVKKHKPVKKLKPSPPPEPVAPTDVIAPDETQAIEVTPEPVLVPVPEPEPAPEMASAATEVAEPAVAEPAVAELPAEPPPPQDDEAARAAQASPDDEDDAGLVLNDNAYRHVETDFDVSTKIDGSAEGKANITYKLLNGQYQLKWLTQPRGLASLVISDLLQTSEGKLTATGLQPGVYVYKYGDKPDKTYTASFDWQNKKVLLHTSKLDKTEDLPKGTQDLLSFMYQFMYVPPLQKMQINIATGRKLAVYDYSFEGEENLNIELGELKTMHIVHTGSESEEKTELWLAIEYQYIPVKIRKTEKNGKVYELRANRIKTVSSE